MEKYATAAYGCCLLDLRSSESNSYFSSWNTAVKLAWDVPRGCRSYFLNNILAPNVPSMKLRILLRFSGFFQSLLESSSREVQTAVRISARDKRRTLGSNLCELEDIIGVNPWSSPKWLIKQKLRETDCRDVGENDVWRMQYLSTLLEQRRNAYYSHNLEEQQQYQSLIDSLVIN